MQLIIEVGNTNIKMVLFQEDVIKKEWKLSSFDAVIFEEITQFPIQKGIISGSGNLDNIWIQSFLKLDYSWIILENEHIPIHSSYDKNSKIGQDRMVNAYWSSELKPFQNNLIIDLGTCLTFTFIDKNNVLVGGSISPGLKMRFESLYQMTHALPNIDYQNLKTISFELIGTSTSESIENGVFRGLLDEIEQKIKAYQNQFNELNVFLTGGDAVFFQNKINFKIFADSNFTIKGLNSLLNRL
jgi:type III pantothenate kinase